VAASSSYTWSYALDLENVPDADIQLVPGAYSVLAQIRLWHQGTFDQLSADPTIPHGSASDEKIVRVP
jgi:hypothetical protein